MEGSSRVVETARDQTQDQGPIFPLSEENLPWLYFGVTRPVGTPVDLVLERLEAI